MHIQEIKEDIENEEKNGKESLILQDKNRNDNDLDNTLIKETETIKEIDSESATNVSDVRNHHILLEIIILIIIACIGLITFKIYQYYHPKTIPISTISISLREEIIDVNTQINVNIIIEPKNYTEKQIKWFSSNPEVISVENGIITALAEGESIIYAINNNGIKSNEITLHSKSKHFIENVPYINQFSLGYPTGCEAVSATMAANYAGYNVKSSQVIEATPTDKKGIRKETKTVEVTFEQVNTETGKIETIIKKQRQTDWYGGNPFEVFVGHPSRKINQGSYGCFAQPITDALAACNIPATNISGCSIDNVFEYIRKGKPVVVWCKKNAGDLIEGITWIYEDGSGTYTELKGEHCAVLIGYDSDYVYLNDPSAGKGVKQQKNKFISNWHILFSQAIVIN